MLPPVLFSVPLPSPPPFAIFILTPFFPFPSFPFPPPFSPPPIFSSPFFIITMHGTSQIIQGVLISVCPHLKAHTCPWNNHFLFLTVTISGCLVAISRWPGLRSWLYLFWWWDGFILWSVSPLSIHRYCAFHFSFLEMYACMC